MGSWQVICSASDTFLVGEDKSSWLLPWLLVPALRADGALPISTSDLGRVESRCDLERYYPFKKTEGIIEGPEGGLTSSIDLNRT